MRHLVTLAVIIAFLSSLCFSSCNNGTRDESGNHLQIFWFESGRIMRLDLTHPEGSAGTEGPPVIVVDNLGGDDAVNYMASDKISNKLFLSQGTQAFYCNLDDSPPYPCIGIPNINTYLYGLAVDEKNKIIYYSIHGASIIYYIMMCNTDGSDAHYILLTGLAVDLKLDTLNKKLFWINNDSVICSSDLYDSGESVISDPRVLLSLGTNNFASAITVDPVGKRLYLFRGTAGMGNYMLQSISITGEDLKDLYSFNFPIVDMDIDPSTRIMYYSTNSGSGGSEIRKINLDTGVDELIYDPSSSVAGILLGP